MLAHAIIIASVLSISPLEGQAESATKRPMSTSNQTPVARLDYIMVFVSDMKRSVAFYRDQVGLKLRFESPGWSEFETGATILALHPSGPKNPAGSSEVGVTVEDLAGFYAARKAAGVEFLEPPKAQSYGKPLTEMRDPDGAVISVGGR